MAAALTAPALSRQTGTTTLSEAAVTAEAPGCSAWEATAALKADVPLLEIPQAVSVVLRNAACVLPGEPFNGRTSVKIKLQACS